MERVSAAERVLTVEGLDDLIRALRRDGRRVLGPTARDGVITHAEISSAADLPAGWTEDQDGGRYRLEPTGTAERFAWSSPSTSWKRFLYPERTLLVRGRRSGGSLEITAPEPEVEPMAFVGVRSCDLAALGVLDRVFLDPLATDPTYAGRRADVFVVAVGCNHPGNTCFCASMNTGPTPSAGYDLAIRELPDPEEPEYLVDSGSERGATLLADLPGRDVTHPDHERSHELHAEAVQRMGREMTPSVADLAAADLDHSRWLDVAQRCLACGNCTMVCPTCFCSTTADETDLTGAELERWRTWDSCFSLDFSHVHGGSVRTSTASRYRQWLLHKLVTWHDQFDTSGCVGCGRCITWCPVGIDITEEAAALAAQEASTP